MAGTVTASLVTFLILSQLGVASAPDPSGGAQDDSNPGTSLKESTDAASERVPQHHTVSNSRDGEAASADMGSGGQEGDTEKPGPSQSSGSIQLAVDDDEDTDQTDTDRGSPNIAVSTVSPLAGTPIDETQPVTKEPKQADDNHDALAERVFEQLAELANSRSSEELKVGEQDQHFQFSLMRIIDTIDKSWTPRDYCIRWNNGSLEAVRVDKNEQDIWQNPSVCAWPIQQGANVDMFSSKQRTATVNGQHKNIKLKNCTEQCLMALLSHPELVNRTENQDVYLYTQRLPCQLCTDALDRLLKEKKFHRFRLGWSILDYGGNNKTIRSQNERRKKRLSQMLGPGGLIRVPAANASLRMRDA